MPICLVLFVFFDVGVSFNSQKSDHFHLVYVAIRSHNPTYQKNSPVINLSLSASWMETEVMAMQKSNVQASEKSFLKIILQLVVMGLNSQNSELEKVEVMRAW